MNVDLRRSNSGSVFDPSIKEATSATFLTVVVGITVVELIIVVGVVTEVEDAKISSVKLFATAGDISHVV